MCVIPGACINETGLCSSAAVVPQSKPTELCSSSMAVVPRSKFTKLCSSAAVVPHKVNLSSCVARWPFRVTQSKSTELCSSSAAVVPQSKSTELCSGNISNIISVILKQMIQTIGTN